ncbi:MAG: efflux RND transporter periplasmic adaptor subunit [Prevotella sp.]|jgi:RND family efflux transporter MFP subunit|nr:efflux RND transporter periplasmic adaptor subunit [Prevotella sp.]MCH4182556.1 efflux RND transporter periplasmic adaptor subunit [Prevotella sp.]MCH4212916.1 efflux RND transporter periplasmic adaptor subunit [Prevotella sp.]MCH4241918.1 efflux RND transporter periplasmic adaptor subunit [Prevotella sp.]
MGSYDKVKIAILLASILMTGCSSKKEKAYKMPPVKVKVETVSEADYHRGGDYLTTVEPDLEAGLSFQVSGNVEAVTVDEGEFVRKGQLLARLSPGRAGDAYMAARAQYDRASDAYKRMKQLYKDKSLPSMKWVESQSDYASALAQLRVAGKDLHDGSLYAPFDGVISKKLIEIGMNVSPGVPVLSLIKIDKINACISIPEKDISGIKLGTPVTVNFPVLKRSFTGRVSLKNLSADPLSQTYTVKVKLSNPHHEILPGMMGRAIVKDKGGRGFLVLPEQAVQLSSDNTRYVWVVNSSGHVGRKKIAVSSETPDGVRVSGEVHLGERVVIEGFQKLSDGMSVTTY